MPAKVTRSAKPAPRPHKPTFPIRKPALVEAAKVNVVPVYQSTVKAVYTRQGWLMWGIMCLCMVIGIFFWEQIKAGADWAWIQKNERVYTELGKDICTRPLLTVAERNCENCFSTDQEILLQRYEAQARAHNLWQAESCIPLM